MQLKHIELFAGCGGMSLGLDAAGFDLYFANELSPMASETFALNLLGEDLQKLSKEGKDVEKSLWIKSNFNIKDLKNRLKENPFDFKNGKFSDINSKTNFEKKLLVGNIDHLLKFLAHRKSICQDLRALDIDLVSGGPPCQGFSLIGKREKDDDKNLLPLSFAKFAGLVKPKVVLLENVKGITSPFTVNEVKYYAWLEVAKAFSLHDFVPICMLINSKYFGIPQNRPRFILLGLRKDVFESFKKCRNNSLVVQTILENSLLFYNKIKNNKRQLHLITTSDIHVYDMESEPQYFDGSLLPKSKNTSGEFVSAEKAIDDISNTDKDYSLSDVEAEYPSFINSMFKQKFQGEPYLQNHIIRKHGFRVKARFRLHQILNELNGLKVDALKVIKGKTSDDDEDVFEKVYNGFKDKEILVYEGNEQKLAKPKSKNIFKEYLKGFRSKKHSQKAIRNDEPAPAQLTIPDDYCHYSIDQLRTFTVREMARFQSFPDWFEFRSKATTGSDMRCYEVPQYTQVGNAVPPLLAYELGTTVSNILKKVAECREKQG